MRDKGGSIMKALYVPLTLLAAILTFSLWAGRYVDQRTEETVALLERASEAGLRRTGRLPPSP